MDKKKIEEALHKAEEDIKAAEALLHEEEAAPVTPAAAPAAAPEPAPAAPAAAPAAGGPPAGKWRVEYDRENCIGAGACVAANADYWSIADDGKADLKGASYDTDRKIWYLVVEDERLLQKQRDAAGVCPVSVIKIIKPDGTPE